MSGKEAGYNITKLVTISGNDAKGDSLSNFHFNLGNQFQKIEKISISTVSFPNNVYNINSTGAGKNNTFAFQDSMGNIQDFALTAGFYTTTTLMAAVQTAINAFLASDDPTASIALTQDTISQLVTATLTGGGGIFQPSLRQAFDLSGIWQILGFVFPSGLGQTLPIGGGLAPITATNLPSLGGLKTAYLHSKALAPGNNFNGDGENTNTLLVIPISAPFGVSNIFECKQDILCNITYPAKRPLGEIDILLGDKDGNPLDLHGGNLIVQLKMWFDRY